MDLIKAIDNSIYNAKNRVWDTIYWAIDLHGTISEFNYSNENLLPKYYPYAKEVLQRLSKNPSVKLILYSCSYAENCYQIVHLMKKDGVIFDYINENPEVKNTEYGDYRKKLYFNILLEDKAGFEPDLDWEILNNHMNKIEEQLRNIRIYNSFQKNKKYKMVSK